MSDWDDDEEVSKTATTSAPTPAPYVSSKKFAGEDEEEEADDWDASEDEKPKQATSTAVASKKRGTLKAKLAEKAAAGPSGTGSDEDDLMDERTPQEIRRAAAEKKAFEKAQEQEADLAHAADLLGITDDPEITSLTKANPKDKAEFQALAQQMYKLVIERLEKKPQYSVFAEELTRQVMLPLTDVEARKITQVMGVVANEKTKEAKEKIGGKKKGASKAKPALGANKALATKVDSNLYDEALDDDDLDFM